MKIGGKGMLVAVIVCIVFDIIAQATYMRTIRLFDDVRSTGFVIKADSMNFYMASKTRCLTAEQDSFTCLGVSKHNHDGEILWRRKFPWSSSANNRSIVVRNDSVFVSGHIIPNVSNLAFNLLILSSTGDSIYGRSFVQNEDSFSSFFNNGLVLVGNDAYLFGQGRDKNNDRLDCVVLKSNFQSMDEELFTFSSDSGKYFPGWDMAVINEDNLAILNEVYNIPGTKREILIFSESGSVVKRLGGPNYGFSSNVTNQMLFLADSTFLFTHNISHFAGDDIPQLIKMGLDGQIDWIHDFPKYWLDDSIGSIGISELTLSVKGDIIIAGVRRRSNDLGTGNDFYVSKMTNDGQILWEHFYNTPISTSTQEYSYNYVQDVQELADQSILVMGGSFHHDDIIILRVDSNGCLNGYDCMNKEIIIDGGTSAIRDQNYERFEPIVMPNPTKGFFSVKFPGSFTGCYQMTTSNGMIVERLNFELQEQINLNLNDMPSGIYYLEILTENNVYILKVAKH